MPCKTDYRRATEKREREREREGMDRSCVTVEDESGTLKSIKLPINLATDRSGVLANTAGRLFFIRERTTRAPWLNGFRSFFFSSFFFPPPWRWSRLHCRGRMHATRLRDDFFENLARIWNGALARRIALRFVRLQVVVKIGARKWL